MFDLKSLFDIADKLGIIEAVKGKLTSQPDPAADKLVIVLEEISKIYGSINTELSRYLSLYFDPSEPSIDDRDVLIALEGGEIKARMGKARGHCHKITNIYLRYLTPWFQKYLSPDEYKVMAELFLSLKESDTKMLYNIDCLADWLTKEASTTLNLIDARKYDEANSRIQAARKEVLESRRSTAQAMRKLLDLQAAFIEVSGAIGFT